MKKSELLRKIESIKSFESIENLPTFVSGSQAHGLIYSSDRFVVADRDTVWFAGESLEELASRVDEYMNFDLEKVEIFRLI